jgi:Tfp pilus assembly protein PilZ
MTDAYQQRRYPRVQLRKQVRVTLANRASLKSLWVSDISKGGMFVQTASALPIRTTIDVSFETPDGTMVLAAEVVHVLTPEMAQPMGASPGMGLQFQALDSGTQAALEQYIEGLRDAPPLGSDGAELTSTDDQQETLEAMQAFLRCVDAEDLYGAIGCLPEAQQDEIFARIKGLKAKLDPQTPGLSPAQRARMERAATLLTRVTAFMGDAARRLDYDLRRGLVLAEQRLADPSGFPPERLREAWFKLHPEHLEPAEKFVALAIRSDETKSLDGAVRNGRQALELDPFNVELRAALAKWEPQYAKLQKLRTELAQPPKGKMADVGKSQ